MIINRVLLPNIDKILLIKVTLTWCVGGRHKNKTINQIVYEKLNPEIKKTDKIIKGKCDLCGQNKSQIFTK